VIQILCGILMIGGGLWLSDFHGALFIGQIPAGVWHSIRVLEPSVIFEAKDGAYVPR